MLRYILSRIFSGKIFVGHRVPRLRFADNPASRLGRRRCGISIVEVLFAIGVVAVGLLGVLALIPVAGALVTQGVIADAGDRLGRNAVREFHVRGMAENGAWWEWSIDNGRYEQFTPRFGESFCIDPMFVARHVPHGASPDGDFRFFPSYTPASPPTPFVRMPRVNLAMGQAPVQWSANTRYVRGQFCQPTTANHRWYMATNTGVSGTVEPDPWPLTGTVTDNSEQSVTWLSVSPAMLFDEAMSTFMSNDDLVFELPADNAANPFQNFTRDAEANAVKRQNQGSFSWMATLTPTPSAGESIYRLSAVVFHRRVLEVDYERISEIPNTEFHSDRINGGDVTLVSDDIEDLQMRQGEWVMLFGPVGSANAFRFRWYRIQMSDSGPRLEGTHYRRDLTLFGEDWPTNAAWTRVLWIPGTIAVYERQVRLNI